MRSVVRPPMRAQIGAPVQPQAKRPDPPSRRRTVRAALISTLLGLLAFLLIQALLAAYNLDVMHDAVDRGLLDVSRRDPVSNLLSSLAYGSLGYLMVSFVGSAIASRGHRVLFALPAAVWVLAGALVGSHQPEPIGAEWGLECYSACSVGPWFGHPWFGPLVDLALVLVPGWTVVRSIRPQRWPVRTDAAAVAAILTVATVVATAGWAIGVVQWGLDERALMAIAALGLAIGVARPWWPWLHVLFASFAAGFVGLMLNFLVWPDPDYRLVDALPHALGQTWPFVTVGLIASAWEPLAQTIRKLEERPIRLAIAVNALNVVDATMTLVAIRSGGALEANPVVQLIGLPTKIALVGLLTWVLYRRKPSALLWPFAALLMVAGYHVAGIFVNGWR